MRSPHMAARVHDVASLALGAAILPDPARGVRARRGYAEYVVHKQRTDAVMHRLAPPLSVLASASGVVAALAAVRSRPGAAALRGLSAALVVAAVVLTVRVSVPINERVATWSPDAEVPGWREERAAWDRWHLLRRALVAASVAAAAAAGRLPR